MVEPSGVTATSVQSRCPAVRCSTHCHIAAETEVISERHSCGNVGPITGKLRWLALRTSRESQEVFNLTVPLESCALRNIMKSPNIWQIAKGLNGSKMLKGKSIGHNVFSKPNNFLEPACHYTSEFDHGTSGYSWGHLTLHPGRC